MYSYLINVGMKSKDYAFQRIKSLFDLNKVRYHLSKPYGAYRIKASKVIYFISSNEKFKKLEEILKADRKDREVFHTFIVVNPFIQIDIRFPEYQDVIKKLENTIYERLN